MAKKQATNGAAFVAALIKDPADIPDLMMLVGYPGASAEEGHTRLYQNAELSHYYDIPDEAILHRTPAGAEADPLDTTYMWVKRDAAILRRHRAQGVQGAAFLHGDITGEHLSPQYQAVATQYGTCPSLGIACTYTPQTCPQVGPTGVLNCTAAPADCGNTAWQGCPPEKAAESGCPDCKKDKDK